ncbi:MAG: YfhO family protein [Anaerolineae bacterium]|nr:YfhO family protein [Anaerolineae bacterium]
MTVPRALRMRSLLEGEARLALRGVSLLNHPTETGQPLVISSGGRFRLVHSGDVKVYENLDFLSRAHLVHQAMVQPRDEEALARLASPDVDPGEQVILAGGRALEGPACVPGDQVVVERYGPEEVVVRTSSAAEGYLVLGDTWYPGWKAAVDGREVEVLRANVLFRAVYVPPGEHEVRMWYAPATWTWGWRLSLAAAAVLAATAAVGWRRRQARRKAVPGV